MDAGDEPVGHIAELTGGGGGGWSPECPIEDSQVNLASINPTDPEDAKYGQKPGEPSSLSVAILRVLRSQMRLTTQGSAYADTYARHRQEMSNILETNPQLRRQFGSAINDFMPAVAGLLFSDVSAFDVELTSTKVNNLQDIVDAFKVNGSASLDDDLDAFMLELRQHEGGSSADAMRAMLGL